MPIKPESRILKAAGVDIYNTIRDNASSTYRDRVPLATQDNILASVGPAILSMQATANEFLSSLVNRIGLVVFRGLHYENPLKAFKMGLMQNGETVEEIFVQIAKASGYNPDQAETEVFKRVIPDVAAVFHKINYQNKFKTTVVQAQLQKAFLTNDGLLKLVGDIIQSLYDGAELDEFLNMKNLIYAYGKLGQFYNVKVPAITAPTEADLKEIVSSFKEYSNVLTFMSDEYNPMAVMTHTPKDKQVLFINAKLDAKIDVNVLAAAFNIDKAEFMGRRVLLDNFGGLENVVAILADESFFVVLDTLVQMTEIYNPEGLYWNYFLHLWKIFSVSPFANAIAFTTVTPSVDEVSMTTFAATVTKGATFQIVATVVAEAGYPSLALTYTISGAQTVKSTVSDSGLVTVAPDEANATLTVTATSVADPTKHNDCVITVA